MKIATIGAGNMARAIGVRLAQHGHRLMFGARRPEQALEAAGLAGADAAAGSTDDAARFGDVLIWTTRETDAARVLGDPALLANKIIIDMNNRDYSRSVATGEPAGRSLGEQLQEALPGAHIVKAFTTIPMEIFASDTETLLAADAQTFIAGNDDAAKWVVTELALELGFRAIDLGSGVVAFRAAEALADVVRHLMGDRGHGLYAHLRLDILPEHPAVELGQRQTGEYR